MSKGGRTFLICLIVAIVGIVVGIIFFVIGEINSNEKFCELGERIVAYIGMFGLGIFSGISCCVSDDDDDD